MPRIDPSQLLQTLKVLLAPDGGIKSPGEVRFRRLIRKIKLQLSFAGAEICSVDAKILQEARLQMHLHPHPDCQRA